jgi:glycosyltransferase involved in cell wall biosynthesis
MKRPIIAFGGNIWDAHWQTRQHVLSRLASRGWPVVYSTGPFFVWDRFGERWNGARWCDRWETLDGVRVYWSGRWQMRWPRVPAWDRWIVRHHARSLREIVNVADDVRPIVYLFRPSFLPYVSAIGPSATVYHADDTFSLMGHWSDDVAAAERALVAHADLVLASSRRIAAALPGGGTVRVMPNGADVAAFASAAQSPCPDDLAVIPHPRVAYAGFLNEKVDFRLVYDIARERPSWHWILIGPEVGAPYLSPSNAGDRTRCASLPNVHFLGSKPHTDVPRYLQNVDVNVMCYRTSEGGWWTDIYPLKLHEYLAVGKPVVASDIDAVREFSAVVAIAATTKDWIAALTKAIEGTGVGNVAERQLVAGMNSWDERVDTLERWFEALPP